jgi:hypothetical protein
VTSPPTVGDAPPVNGAMSETVQLPSIVARVTEQAYSQLTMLVRPPPTPHVTNSRRRDLCDYCLLMRNSFLRLLALVRWIKRERSMRSVRPCGKHTTWGDEGSLLVAATAYCCMVSQVLTVHEFLHRCDISVCNVASVMREHQVCHLRPCLLCAGVCGPYLRVCRFSRCKMCACLCTTSAVRCLCWQGADMSCQ